MHDPGLLGVQELPGPFDGPDVDASGDHGAGPGPLRGHQPVRQVHDEAVHGQRFPRGAKAASIVRDSLAFVDTGSLTNGSGQGLPRRVRTASARRDGSTQTIRYPNPSPVPASLGGLFVLAALPSCSLWLAFGAAVQPALHSHRRLRAFNIAMGALLALSIVIIAR